MVFVALSGDHPPVGVIEGVQGGFRSVPQVQVDGFAVDLLQLEGFQVVGQCMQVSHCPHAAAQPARRRPARREWPTLCDAPLG